MQLLLLRINILEDDERMEFAPSLQAAYLQMLLSIGVKDIISLTCIYSSIVTSNKNDILQLILELKKITRIRFYCSSALLNLLLLEVKNALQQLLIFELRHISKQCLLFPPPLALILQNKLIYACTFF